MTQTLDRSSWTVKDTDILEELLVLMNISPQEAALMKALQAEAHAQAPALAETFYLRLMAHEHTRQFLEEASLERRHSMLADWFFGLFGGVYDETYARQRMKIGHIHVQIGLPVRYPLAMLDVIMHYGEIVTAKSPEPELAKEAFRKLLSLDIAVFNQAYEDNQLKHLSEVVGGERLARLLLTGKG